MGLLYGDLDPVEADAGCDLATSCLDCPFERCLQEEPGGEEQYLLAQRDNRIAAHFREGKGTYQIARDLGVSQRTVQRALKRTRARAAARQAAANMRKESK